MNVADAAKAIYQRWMAQWPTLSGGVPYVFDNDVLDAKPTYARVRVRLLDSEQYTLGQAGARKFQHTGIIEVELHAPGNSGRKLVDLMVGYVRTIFESVRFGVTGSEEGVTTYATNAGDASQESMGSARVSSNANDWVLIATTAFEFYEVR